VHLVTIDTQIVDEDIPKTSSLISARPKTLSFLLLNDHRTLEGLLIYDPLRPEEIRDPVCALRQTRSIIARR
jgi:hypothetical protein